MGQDVREIDDADQLIVIAFQVRCVVKRNGRGQLVRQVPVSRQEKSGRAVVEALGIGLYLMIMGHEILFPVSGHILLGLSDDTIHRLLPDVVKQARRKRQVVVFAADFFGDLP